MIKKEIYPKTKRISVDGFKIQLTEKLDGSNLAIFKKNDTLYIAQRKNIFSLDELEEAKQILYKGMYEWLKTNGEYLKEHLIENSCICGEWLGMGTLKYTIDEFDKRLYMFAKANVDDEFNLYNLMYDHTLFKYPFDNQELPNFIGEVPIIADIKVAPDKNMLDSIYSKYCEKVGGRNVEGIVINCNNLISKYVRMKSGKLVEYSDNDHKGVE
jgi:hypothetical protein